MDDYPLKKKESGVGGERGRNRRPKKSAKVPRAQFCSHNLFSELWLCH